MLKVAFLPLCVCIQLSNSSFSSSPPIGQRLVFGLVSAAVPLRGFVFNSSYHLNSLALPSFFRWGRGHSTADHVVSPPVHSDREKDYVNKYSIITGGKLSLTSGIISAILNDSRRWFFRIFFISGCIWWISFTSIAKVSYPWRVGIWPLNSAISLIECASPSYNSLSYFSFSFSFFSFSFLMFHSQRGCGM